VVQQLVDANASGVMFTADPVTGVRDEIVVNAAWGWAVVGGGVTPDTVVARNGIWVVSREVHEKAVTVRTRGGPLAVSPATDGGPGCTRRPRP
jgi:pyruvate,water dikinase